MARRNSIPLLTFDAAIAELGADGELIVPGR